MARGGHTSGWWLVVPSSPQLPKSSCPDCNSRDLYDEAVEQATDYTAGIPAAYICCAMCGWSSEPVASVAPSTQQETEGDR